MNPEPANITEAREALAELQSLHAEGWCACRSSTLPERVERALRNTLGALADREHRIALLRAKVADDAQSALSQGAWRAVDRILSDPTPERTNEERRSAARALRDLGAEIVGDDGPSPTPQGVDPFETGRKPLIIADRVITVPLTQEANYALQEWIGNNLDSLAETLAPHGLHPADIQKPTYTRVVYEDELQQARWVIAAEATNEVQQPIDATPGRIMQFPQPFTSSTALAVCPECRDGKHQNCTDLALDRNDEWVACSCECRAA